MSIPSAPASMRASGGMPHHTRHLSAQTGTETAATFMDRRTSGLGTHARKPADHSLTSGTNASEVNSGINPSEARAAHLVKTTQRRGQYGKRSDRPEGLSMHMLANRIMLKATTPHEPQRLNFGQKTLHRPQASLFASSALRQGKRPDSKGKNPDVCYATQGAQKDVRSLRR